MIRNLILRGICLVAMLACISGGLHGVSRSAAQSTEGRLLHVAEAIPQQYIVVLARSQGDRFTPALQANEREQRLADAYHAQVGVVYTQVFEGFSARMTAEDAWRMSQDPGVRYVEEDGVVRALDEQVNPPSWGLCRISERKLALQQPYYYPHSAGSGINVYVEDTGIMTSHKDFHGRAHMIKNYISGEADTDLNGHGTNVAGIIGSTTYGVAKEVKLYGIKVMDRNGQGTFSNVIAGIDLVTGLVKPGQTVLNMSLGGGFAQSVNDAVNAAYNAGVVVVVAAGNSNIDACTQSPAGASDAFAVGATDDTDTVASYSNQGKCVSLFAPGSEITSLWIGSNTATNTISGTSMASPHVAGIAALFMAQKQYTSAAEVHADLISAATTGVLKHVQPSTANRLAYNGGS